MAGPEWVGHQQVPQPGGESVQANELHEVEKVVPDRLPATLLSVGHLREEETPSSLPDNRTYTGTRPVRTRSQKDKVVDTVPLLRKRKVPITLLNSFIVLLVPSG